MVPVFPNDLTASAPIKRSQSSAPPESNSRKAKATPLPGNRSQNDRPASAPLPLSLRKQQVCEYFSQGVSFEAIANHLGLSPAAAREYHRRALDKHQRTIALASAPLEQGESYARRLRQTPATPEPAKASPQEFAEPPCDRGSSALALGEQKLCTQSAPFHSPAVAVPVLVECSNLSKSTLIDWTVLGKSSGYFIPGEAQFRFVFSFDVEGSIPRHPFRRKRTSRRSRRAGVGFRVALAS